MLWFVAVVSLLVVCVLGLRLWRAWARPWHEVELLVNDVTAGRSPRTFLVNGNRTAERIGVALEDVFLRQRDLAHRAEEDELNIRAILGAMRDGLAVIDDEGRVRIANAALRKLFAISGEQLGRNSLETFRDAVVADLVARTLRSGETGTASLHVRSHSSDDRRIAITALPMKRDDDSPFGLVVLFHDVTQLQQLEQVRREFVSNVSHELRTPLSIFRGYLETLLDEPDLPAEERERILRVLEKHSTRLHSLVDDLLSLARLEAPDPQLHFAPVALDQLLNRVARDWEKRLAEKQLTITQDISKDLPAINADEARLEEVLHNLLDNAMKYSPPNSRITLSARCDDDNAIALSVRDEGSGIAAADLPRIFERFYRADKARSREVGGTGLGLAIVKHIAQLHGGSVTAESQLGHGTTIRVTLPLSRTGASPTA